MYDDGDVEDLNLSQETWEYDTAKKTKRKRASGDDAANKRLAVEKDSNPNSVSQRGSSATDVMNNARCNSASEHGLNPVGNQQRFVPIRPRPELRRLQPLATDPGFISIAPKVPVFMVPSPATDVVQTSSGGTVLLGGQSEHVQKPDTCFGEKLDEDRDGAPPPFVSKPEKKRSAGKHLTASPTLKEPPWKQDKTDAQDASASPKPATASKKLVLAASAAEVGSPRPSRKAGPPLRPSVTMFQFANIVSTKHIGKPFMRTPKTVHVTAQPLKNSPVLPSDCAKRSSRPLTKMTDGAHGQKHRNSQKGAPVASKLEKAKHLPHLQNAVIEELSAPISRSCEKVASSKKESRPSTVRLLTPKHSATAPHQPAPAPKHLAPASKQPPPAPKQFAPEWKHSGRDDEAYTNAYPADAKPSQAVSACRREKVPDDAILPQKASDQPWLKSPDTRDKPPAMHVPSAGPGTASPQPAHSGLVHNVGKERSAEQNAEGPNRVAQNVNPHPSKSLLGQPVETGIRKKSRKLVLKNLGKATDLTGAKANITGSAVRIVHQDQKPGANTQKQDFRVEVKVPRPLSAELEKRKELAVSNGSGQRVREKLIEKAASASTGNVQQGVAVAVTAQPRGNSPPGAGLERGTGTLHAPKPSRILHASKPKPVSSPDTHAQAQVESVPQASKLLLPCDEIQKRPSPIITRIPRKLLHDTIVKSFEGTIGRQISRIADQVTKMFEKSDRMYSEFLDSTKQFHDRLDEYAVEVNSMTKAAEGLVSELELGEQLQIVRQRLDGDYTKFVEKKVDEGERRIKRDLAISVKNTMDEFVGGVVTEAEKKIVECVTPMLRKKGNHGHSDGAGFDS